MREICALFRLVCNMSLTAGVVILMVLLARQLLKKVPRKFSYCLWLVVAFRLLCPYSVPSGISMFNLEFFRDMASAGNQVIWNLSEVLNGTPWGQTAVQTGDEAGAQAETFFAEQNADGFKGEGNRTGQTGENPVTPADPAEREGMTNALSAGDGSGKAGTAYENGSAGGSHLAGNGIFGLSGENITLMEVLTVIWLAGIVVFLSYQLAAYLRLKKHVETAVRSGQNIYESDTIHTPFVMGFFSPRIYLPFRLTEQERTYILLHEQYHIRRKDHQIKVLSVLLLAVYWFQPLVWIAYHAMCKDMEMSCDEMVIAKLGSKVKEDYSRSLLGFAVKGRNFAAAPLAFGEVPVKTRIKNILRFQSPKRAAMLFGLVVCILVAVIGVGNGRNRNGIRFAGRRSISAGDRLNFDQAVSYEYELPKNVQSLLLYKESYRNGVLEDYTQVALHEIEDGQRKGTFTIERELFQTKVGEADAIFSLQFPGREESVVDYSSLQPSGFAGVAETYYMENNDDWTKIEPGTDIVIAAWNLGLRETDGVEGISCTHFMDQNLKWDALGRNDGEILYHLVFSEKSAQELEEEYAVSPYVKELYTLKNPYIGDAVADGKLVHALGIAQDLARTMELETTEEPYALVLHFEDSPENEAEFYQEMVWKATALLVLIDNAGRVEWNYPAEEGGVEVTRHFSWSKEQAKQALGAGNLQEFAGDERALQNFFVKVVYEQLAYEKLPETEQGFLAPNGKTYRNRQIMTGRHPNAAASSTYLVYYDDPEITFQDITDYFFSSDSAKAFREDMYVTWPTEEGEME
ncbi:M56 family metallopeptidase [Roseburia hominis]